MSELPDLELEWRLIYAVVVAGKSARFANAAVFRLRGLVPPTARPIPYLARRPHKLAAAATGRYRAIEAALLDLADLDPDLRTVVPEELERVRGIGPKTARFFVVWTRSAERYAVLDVHVLRWLRGLGYDAPRATPPSARYAELEAAFLREADRRGLTPRELDRRIWGDAATAPNVA